MANETAQVRFLGTADDVNTCECCGRKNLKHTVALSFDDGEAVFYGTSCAAVALRMPAIEVKRSAKKVDDEKRNAEMATRQAADRSRYAAFQTWLDAQLPSLKGERFLQLQELGGYKAAHGNYLQTIDKAAIS